MKHALHCALALSALALPLSACGGSGGEAASAADKEAERDAAQVRLQQCLREQGVDLPRPGDGGGDRTIVRPSAAERRKVEQALNGPCKKHRGKAFGDGSEEDRQEMRDRMAKFTACLRREGVDIPDFRPGAGEEGAQRSAANPNSPRFGRAEKKCRKLLPQSPGGPGGGPGGGPQIQIGPPPGGAE